jgi:hypothetical protein
MALPKDRIGISLIEFLKTTLVGGPGRGAKFWRYGKSQATIWLRGSISYIW